MLSFRRFPAMILISAVALIGARPPAAAQAVLAQGGRTLFNRQLLVRVFNRVERFGDVKRHVQSSAVVYGFLPDWQATAVAPTVSGPRDGLADSRFFVKYDGLYKKNVPGGLTRLSAEFGVQASTGSDGLSTGAVAYLADVVFLRAREGRHILADVQYEAATRNEQGVTVGDRALFDLALSYLFIPDNAKTSGEPARRVGKLAPHGVYAIVEFNVETSDAARDAGGPLPDTGGTVVYVSPGIQYFLKRNFILEAAAPIPIARNLVGNQPKPKVGVLFGFRYVL